MYYDKTAQVLSALRGMLGESTFHRAYREYGRRWLNRHPYPYDFFNTIEDVSKQDLGWFWSSWFFEAWPLDQAIASVKNDGSSVAITIEDRGLAPMPVELAVTRARREGAASAHPGERVDERCAQLRRARRTHAERNARGDRSRSAVPRHRPVESSVDDASRDARARLSRAAHPPLRGG